MHNAYWAAIIIVGVLLWAPVWAVNGDLGISTDPNTNGSAAFPWLIEDLADFEAFAASSAYWAAGVHTKLMTDLDLGGTTYTAAVIAPDTDPAASGFQGVRYSGTFYGLGFTIAHLTINGMDDCGLWGSIGSSGSVQYLNLTHATVSGRSRVGSLCGTNLGGIARCCVTSEVSGHMHVGGLCGHNYGGDLDHCGAIGHVTATGSHAGGLCGGNWDNDWRGGTSDVLYCYAIGTVIAAGDFVGGLCGYNRCRIAGCYAVSSVSGNMGVGGLCGFNTRLEDLRQDGRITTCYAGGSVSGTDGLGGLCGSSYTYLINPPIANCYFLQAAGLDNGHGTPLSDSQMKQQSSYVGWSFNGDWMMLREGEDYPRLAWQEIFSGDIAGLYGVDLVDFAELARNWMEACPGDCEQADIDASGMVGLGDLEILAGDWMKSVAP